MISPGPGRPERERDVGVSLDVLRRARVPVLGVCLGHQALAHVTGGAIEHAPEVMHGRLSSIHHDGGGLFAGIPQGFAAVRYHSLVVAACPAELRVTAWTPDGVVMGLEHRTRPQWGVQFHPESVSTEHGRALARNFRDLTRAHGRSPGAQRGAPPADPPPARACTTARSRPGAIPRPRSSRSSATASMPCGSTARAWSPGSRASRSWAPRMARSARSSATTSPTRALTIERASGREERRESVLDYCERELERLRADAPELPFDFTCGFAGYLGYELKAELRGRARPPLAACPTPRSCSATG